MAAGGGKSQKSEEEKTDGSAEELPFPREENGRSPTTSKVRIVSVKMASCAPVATTAAAAMTA